MSDLAEGGDNFLQNQHSNSANDLELFKPATGHLAELCRESGVQMRFFGLKRPASALVKSGTYRVDWPYICV